MSEVKYVVTGKTTDGRRFKRTFDENGFRWAMMINLWQGSVWQETDGKRKLLKRVWN